MHSNEIAIAAAEKTLHALPVNHQPAPNAGELIGTVLPTPRRAARVILVEDNPDLLEGLRQILETSGQFECCAAMTELPPDLGPLARLRADLVLLDIHLQGINALDLLPRLKCLMPNSRIAIYSGDEDAEQVHKAVALGADGYVIKGLPRDALLETLNGILRGAAALCPRATNGLFQYLRTPAPVLTGQELLTPREREILELLVNARRAKQIANLMGIAAETVRTHIRNIYNKLDVSSRAELILRVSPQHLARPVSKRRSIHPAAGRRSIRRRSPSGIGGDLTAPQNNP
jgi:DNA-binding NarL/FixJ family response regulator